MYRKFVVFVVCLVCVCCVFGLNDRLHYEGFKRSAEHIDGSFTVVTDDINAVACFAFAVENFDSEKGGRVSVDGEVLRLSFGGVGGDFVFSSSEQSEKIAKVLKPMTLRIENDSGAFEAVTDGLNAVLFWVGVLVSVVVFLLALVFDIVGVAWGAVEAVLYLLGISSL